MIVPASGHQVRCIPWVQMGTFNKEIGFLCGLKFFALNIFCGEYLQSIYIWCCKYGENRYCERCANKKLYASKHTGLLNSCLGKLCLHPYLVVPIMSARVTLISTRVSAHCQAILLIKYPWMVTPLIVAHQYQNHIFKRPLRWMLTLYVNCGFCGCF